MVGAAEDGLRVLQRIFFVKLIYLTSLLARATDKTVYKTRKMSLCEEPGFKLSALKNLN